MDATDTVLYEDGVMQTEMGCKSNIYVRAVLENLDIEMIATGLTSGRADIVMMIMRSIVRQQVEWVNEKLRLRVSVTKIVTETEMYRFLAIIWWSHLTNVPMNDVVTQFEPKGIATHQHGYSGAQ